VPPASRACDAYSHPAVAALQARFREAQAGLPLTAAMKVAAPLPEVVEPFPPGTTTVVVHNIPPICTQEDIIALWPNDGTYNFLHMPFNVRQRRSAGYAFVNFVAESHADAFRRGWHGRCAHPQLCRDPSAKAALPLSVEPARIQGFRANIENAKRGKVTSITNPRYMPAIFSGSARVDFHAALALYGGGDGVGGALRCPQLSP